MTPLTDAHLLPDFDDDGMGLELPVDAPDDIDFDHDDDLPPADPMGIDLADCPF